ncbi:hypothetical protein WN944_006980 [Citrus x changshan-huyou]|uniref:Cytochrome P450 n=1 Tax=Citrus x changshan-huyou TaxID=2935761 RepID=A0AAP0MM20_9ROSI
MADKYGPIFTIKIGINRALVVSSWEMAKECLTTNDKIFASRPKTLAMEILGYNFSMFGSSPYGSYWRETRKIATLELLSNHRLEKLRHVRDYEVKTCLKELYELWDKSKSTNKMLVEMKRWFADTICNVILRMIVGKGCNSVDSEEWMELLTRFLEMSGKFVVSDALPFLRWLDIGGDERSMKKTAEELDIVVQGWQVNESDLKNLVYLQATLKEAMRLYPAVPLLIPHEAIEECTVNGYHVPAGTQLLINVWKLQRDPRVWEEPCKFQPERFLTKHKDIDVRGQHLELLPFGSGRRMCPGVSFALQVMQFTIASLLQGFDFATPSNEPLDMGEGFGLTMEKSRPLEVLIAPRLSASLYG